MGLVAGRGKDEQAERDLSPRRCMPSHRDTGASVGQSVDLTFAVAESKYQGEAESKVRGQARGPACFWSQSQPRSLLGWRKQIAPVSCKWSVSGGAKTSLSFLQVDSLAGSLTG